MGAALAKSAADMAEYAAAMEALCRSMGCEHTVTVLQGVRAGEQIVVDVGGQKITVICPAGVQAGMNLRFKTFGVIVPTGVLPGQEFPWLADGKSLSLTCPPNVRPGQIVLFGLPIADSMMTCRQSKRRKIAGDASLRATTCPIYNLFPAGILREVASYLEAPSRILFAIAIEPPSTSTRSPYAKILARCKPKLGLSPITSNLDWHTLDFGDIEKELAAKLTDEDISKVLLHVDAAFKVKRLFLTNCTGITGTCLASLRNCTSIEQIDMSLVKAHKSPALDPAPQLSCDQVLPILRSIISQEKNSLKHLQFPLFWRSTERAEDSDFVAFLNEYNQMVENRDTSFCKKCNDYIDEGAFMDTGRWGPWFANQGDICSLCTNIYCYECSADDNHFSGACLCHTCQRRYCSKCSTMVECEDCSDMHCVVCASFTECANPECMRTFCNDCRLHNSCPHCSKSWCDSCSNGLHLHCDMCEEKCCAECSEKEGTNGVYPCDECRGNDVSRDSLCDLCRVHKCKVNDDCCKSCVKIVSALILKENKQLHDETKGLKEEIKILKNETKKMRNDISTAKIILNKY